MKRKHHGAFKANYNINTCTNDIDSDGFMIPLKPSKKLKTQIPIIPKLEIIAPADSVTTLDQYKLYGTYDNPIHKITVRKHALLVLKRPTHAHFVHVEKGSSICDINYLCAGNIVFDDFNSFYESTTKLTGLLYEQETVLDMIIDKLSHDDNHEFANLMRETIRGIMAEDPDARDYLKLLGFDCIGLDDMY